MLKNWLKRDKFYGDFAFLGTDMHSHLLPGIDDGSQSPEDSLRFMQRLQSLGWKGAIATPHVLSDLYPNSPATIEPAYRLLADTTPPGFTLRYAAEYMVDEYFEKLFESCELLCLANNQVLIEMSYLAESPRIRETVFTLRTKGYQPVLAHPERYNFYHRRYDRLIELKDMGCLFQLNLLSVAGYYGTDVRKMSLKLLGENMYDYAGTDLHHDRHASALEQLTLQKNIQLLCRYPFRNMEL